MTTLHPRDLDWCVRRAPQRVREAMQANPGRLFLAGGFIRSCIANEKVNDVDLFVPSHNDAERLALDLAGGDEARLYRTENALSVRGLGPMVQVIHRWTFDRPEDAIASFDFTIASAALWHDGAQWCSTCHPDYYADLAARRLVYLSPAREGEPGGSLLRVLKFYQRGYRIPLDSLGAVLARLMTGAQACATEADLAQAITGLLREVDPVVDPDHVSHLPADRRTP